MNRTAFATIVRTVLEKHSAYHKIKAECTYQNTIGLRSNVITSMCTVPFSPIDMIHIWNKKSKLHFFQSFHYSKSETSAAMLYVTLPNVSAERLMEMSLYHYGYGQHTLPKDSSRQTGKIKSRCGRSYHRNSGVHSVNRAYYHSV